MALLTTLVVFVDNFVGIVVLLPSMTLVVTVGVELVSS